MKKYLNKRNIIIAICCTLIVTGLILNFIRPEENITPSNTTFTTKQNNYIVVEIKGEVKKPGIYQLEEDSRIYDLIVLAGGVTKDATTDTLNFAQKITDGMSIIIDSKNIEDDRISINEATIEQLKSLEGIGDTKANNIIKYRQQIGRFSSLEQLKNVEGISAKIYEQLITKIKL